MVLDDTKKNELLEMISDIADSRRQLMRSSLEVFENFEENRPILRTLDEVQTKLETWLKEANAE